MAANKWRWARSAWTLAKGRPRWSQLQRNNKSSKTPESTGTENVASSSYNWKDYTGQLSGGNRSNVTAINCTYSLPKFAKAIHFDDSVARAVIDGWQIAT